MDFVWFVDLCFFLIRFGPFSFHVFSQSDSMPLKKSTELLRGTNKKRRRFANNVAENWLCACDEYCIIGHTMVEQNEVKLTISRHDGRSSAWTQISEIANRWVISRSLWLLLFDQLFWFDSILRWPFLVFWASIYKTAATKTTIAINAGIVAVSRSLQCRTRWTTLI